MPSSGLTVFTSQLCQGSEFSSHSKPRAADCAPAPGTLLPTARILLLIWSLRLHITPYTSLITYNPQNMGKKNTRGTSLSQVTLSRWNNQRSQKMSKMPDINLVPVQTFQVKNTRKSRKLNESGILASNTSWRRMRALQGLLNWLHSDKTSVLDRTKLCKLHFKFKGRCTVKKI